MPIFKGHIPAVPKLQDYGGNVELWALDLAVYLEQYIGALVQDVQKMDNDTDLRVLDYASASTAGTPIGLLLTLTYSS